MQQWFVLIVPGVVPVDRVYPEPAAVIVVLVVASVEPAGESVLNTLHLATAVPVAVDEGGVLQLGQQVPGKVTDLNKIMPGCTADLCWRFNTPQSHHVPGPRRTR